MVIDAGGAVRKEYEGVGDNYLVVLAQMTQ